MIVLNTIQEVLSFENKLKDNINFQLEAVRQNGYSIQYIKDPYLEVQLEAVKRNEYSIQYIKDPCIEVQQMALNNSSKPNIYLFLIDDNLKEECILKFL